jgi:hypothetical protein
LKHVFDVGVQRAEHAPNGPQERRRERRQKRALRLAIALERCGSERTQGISTGRIAGHARRRSGAGHGEKRHPAKHLF